VLSTLFNNLAGITKIIIPADFRSARGTKAVKCSVRANEGILYPLKSSLIFIHKPVHYIRHAEIKFVEFSRIAQGGQAASRSFDLTITKLKDNTVISFASIESEEQRLLTDYFKAAGIKMRVIDAETRQVQQLESEGSDSDNSAAADGKRKRNKAGSKDVAMNDDYDSEEDDEDFNESKSGGDSESGEGEMDESD
jgi:structure-specific recognition protein 1